MVRIKQLVGLPYKPNTCSYESSQSSSDSTQTEHHSMARKRKESVVNQAETLVLGSGESLSLEDGRWRRTEYFFVRKGSEVDDERFSVIYPGNRTIDKNWGILTIMTGVKWIGISVSCPE